MAMRRSSIMVRPRSTASGVTSRSTSRPYSERPIVAPSATAIGRPIIPVPGMPTPIAFLSMLALNRTSIRSGSAPSSSAARAAHSATATGSVHPMAGITSRRTRSNIRSLSRGEIIVVVFLATASPRTAAIPPTRATPEDRMWRNIGPRPDRNLRTSAQRSVRTRLFVQQI